MYIRKNIDLYDHDALQLYNLAYRIHFPKKQSEQIILEIVLSIILRSDYFSKWPTLLLTISNYVIMK